MNSIMKVKQVLQQREEAILSMEKKLNRSQTLNKTLLTALERSISSNILSYNEREAIRQETTDCLYTLDNEILLQDTHEELVEDYKETL